MSFCNHCGTRLPPEAKFCPACGGAVELSGAAPEQREPDAQSRRDVQPGHAVIPSLDYVGLGKRFVAHLVDLIIVFIIFYVIGMQVAGEVGGVTREGFSLEGTPALVTMGLSFVASLGYFMLTEGRNGQSFGKLVTGIKVVSSDGSPCSMRQAFIRNFLRLIDGLFFYFVGVILIARSDRNQRLGDRIAETVVIRKAKVAAKGSYVYRADGAPEAETGEGDKVKFRSSWGIKKGRDAWDL